MSNTMQVLGVTGITKGSGISRKSGTPKPYDFAQISYLVGATSISKEETNITNYGYDVRIIGIRNDVQTIDLLKNMPFLESVNLVLEADPSNPSRNIVVGWEVSEF